MLLDSPYKCSFQFEIYSHHNCSTQVVSPYENKLNCCTNNFTHTVEN